MYIPRSVRFQAKINPNTLAVADRKSIIESVTFFELVDLASRLREYLRARGISPADSIAVYFEDSILQIMTILALFELEVASIEFLSAIEATKGESSRLITDQSASASTGDTDIQIGQEAFQEKSPAIANLKSEGHVTNLRFPLARSSENQPKSIVLQNDEIVERIHKWNLAKSGLVPTTWIIAGHFRTEPALISCLENLCMGRSTLVGSGRLEDDIQAIELFQAAVLHVQDSNISQYFGSLGNRRGLSTGLRAVVVSGVRFDLQEIKSIKSRVSNNVRLVLDNPRTGPFATSVDSGETPPQRFFILPNVEIRTKVAVPETASKAGIGEIFVRTKAPGDQWMNSGVSGRLELEGVLLVSSK